MGTPVVALIVLICASADQGHPTLDVSQVIQGIKDADSAILDYSVRCEIECHELLPRSNAILDTSIEAYSTCDSKGRFLYEATEKRREAKNALTVNLKSAFNGIEYQSLRGSDGVYTHGYLSHSIGSSMLTWRMNPNDFLYSYKDIKIAQWLEGDGVSKYSRSESSPDVVTIETKEVVNRNKAWKAIFVVDCSKAFAVVKRSLLVSAVPSKEDGWKEYTTMACKDYVEPSPGVWTPSLVVDTSFKTEVGSTERERVVRSECTYRLNQWKVNGGVAESVYRLSLPPNVTVEDRIRNNTYHSSTITDQMLKDMVWKGRNLAPSGRRPTHVRLFVQANLAILVFLAGAYFCHRAVRLLRSRDQ